MKRLAVLLIFCMLLTGCAMAKSETNPAMVNENLNAEITDADETNETSSIEDEEQKREIIEFLEQFENELSFDDMDDSDMEAYVGTLAESYDFMGRETEDGIGYILGFKKVESSLLDSLSIYEIDDYIEADIWSEQEEKYKTVYEFKNISVLARGNYHDGGVNEILYLQPKDMGMPEELEDAFRYRYCYGIREYEYVEDVLSRGVRFTPPDTEAYLAVDRYENGIQMWEYVTVSEEEEKEILESDEVIEPELYGYYGLEFFVSQKTYEEMEIEKGEITLPALKIAESRCRFKVRELSEIHDIIEAGLELYAWDEENEEMRMITETITDPDKIKELEGILTSPKESGEGKCPYTGILTLTRQDGEEITISLATDSCDGFILESHGFYSPGKEATERIWELFPEVRKYTGWRLEEQEILGNMDGPAGEMMMGSKK